MNQTHVKHLYNRIFLTIQIFIICINIILIVKSFNINEQCTTNCIKYNNLKYYIPNNEDILNNCNDSYIIQDICLTYGKKYCEEKNNNLCYFLERGDEEEYNRYSCDENNKLSAFKCESKLLIIAWFLIAFGIIGCINQLITTNKCFYLNGIMFFNFMELLFTIPPTSIFFGFTYNKIEIIYKYLLVCWLFLIILKIMILIYGTYYSYKNKIISGYPNFYDNNCV